MRVRSLLLAFVLASACTPPPVAPPPPPPCPEPEPPPPPPEPVVEAPPPVVLPPSVPDTPVEHALAQLFADAWEERMRESPTLASVLGDRRYNDRWPERSEAAFARRNAHAIDLLARLQAIPVAELSPPSQLNRAIFEKEYALEVEGFAYGLDALAGGASLYAPMTQQGGPQSAGDLANELRFETAKDYEDWLRRMETFPAYVDDTTSVMREGMKRTLLYPRVVMQRVTAQIDRQIVTSPEQSSFYKPFTRFPAAIGDDDRARLTAAAKRAITTRIVPAYQTLKAFFTKEYLPACFDQAGLWQVPRGDEAYAFLVRLHTTTTLTPSEIHELGLREVARIRGEMQQTMQASGFKGTLKEFFVKLRTDPRFFYKTPEELEQAYRATAKRIDPLLGRHLQIALTQDRGDVPQFRRSAEFTAFVEGWGLYAESLGGELGLYDDPYAKFGQLAYEMWRAIRLVVDTGMHAMKWDRQKAIDYFLENDPKPALDVTNEIDRYLVSPGQALAYEIGELKIRELRAKATTELGPRFDVREFHDAVLEQGAVPLDVLERHIDDWITSKKPAAPTPAPTP